MGRIKLIEMDDNTSFWKRLVLFFYEIEEVLKSGIQLIEYNVDMILLDISIPSFETAKRISFTYPKTKMVALTMYQDKFLFNKLISLAFKVFVSKNSIPEDLVNTIK